MKNQYSILTKRGALTGYAYSCGYKRTEEVNNVRFSLDKTNNVYNVRVLADGIRTWETYKTLRESQKSYNEFKRMFLHN